MLILNSPLRRPRRRGGFTLLEIMMVVMIIALLLGAAIRMMGTGPLNDAKRVRVEADLQAIRTALLQYEGATGNLPTTEQGLQALVSQPQTEPRPTSWRKVLTDVPKDAWQQEYVYVQPGKHNPDGYDVFSKGPDRVAETDDDMGNWKK